MEVFEALTQLARRHGPHLLEHPNVLGYGVGLRTTAGRLTNQHAVVVLVRRKVPARSLTRWEKVPAQIGDAPVDVLETGDIVALGAWPAALARNLSPPPPPTGRATPASPWYAYGARRERPAYPGLSIGHVRITAGTLGAVVTGTSGEHPFILSNNHVLANAATVGGHEAAQGDAILQPGPADGGRPGVDTLAALTRWVALRPSDEPAHIGARCISRLSAWLLRLLLPGYRMVLVRRTPPLNQVDAAIAAPIESGSVLPAPPGQSPPVGITAPSPGATVRKTGRSTGVTQGTIIASDVAVDVSYGRYSARFAGQFLVTPMGAPGDSGSLLLSPDNRAVGLLFAGSPSVTLATPIERVMEALDIRLASAPPSARPRPATASTPARPRLVAASRR